ncbi:MAG: 16S rRNA (cytosine(1402)-N(4))-methyltransferase RsmH [Acidobacteriota bacterium]|nr:16S rRNA (cytosine(1402)-N(4))-methyltransferase RsmH [Acidobacteriota bacterium]
MLQELVGALEPREGQVVIDCTFGAGGHAREVAGRLGRSGTLIAIDRDPLAERCFAQLAREVPCAVRFIGGSFRDSLELLAAEGVRTDGVYFDLGVSSMQIDRAERGFAYSYDAPLDMRMDPRQPLTAGELVNTADERTLAGLMRELGEERHARPIAHAIVERRAEARIESTLALVETINAAIPAPARFAAGHPARRVFQALRIAVNDELGELDRALPAAWGILRDGGVLAAIAFHSLEDRRVKRFLAELARGCVCPPELPVCTCDHVPEAELRFRRAVLAGAEEIERNPRAASARLRAARKLSVDGSAGRAA